MKNKTNLKIPLVEFLEFYLHLHKLNIIVINSVGNYEKLSNALENAKRVLKKFNTNEIDSEVKYTSPKKEEIIEAARKEISENYYTIKSSEVILIYSRLESAITETIYLFFKQLDITKKKEIGNIKINAIEYLKTKKAHQSNFLADQYMYQTSQSIKYGFNRFEAILEPFIGRSTLIKKDQDNLFRFAQYRNLLIHKNGVVDREFKNIFKSNKYKLNKRVDIDRNTLEIFYKSVLAYADNILERLSDYQ